MNAPKISPPYDKNTGEDSQVCHGLNIELCLKSSSIVEPFVNAMSDFCNVSQIFDTTKSYSNGDCTSSLYLVCTSQTHISDTLKHNIDFGRKLILLNLVCKDKIDFGSNLNLPYSISIYIEIKPRASSTHESLVAKEIALNGTVSCDDIPQNLVLRSIPTLRSDTGSQVRFIVRPSISCKSIPIDST